MKVERTTRRHTPIPNPTRSSNRIREQKQFKESDQGDLAVSFSSQSSSSQSSSFQSPASQEVPNSSFTSSIPSNEGSFSSFSSNEQDAETQVLPSLASTDLLNTTNQHELVTTIVRNSQDPARRPPGDAPRRYPQHLMPGSDQPGVTAGQVARGLYGDRIVIDSTLSIRLSNEAALRSVRQRRPDMDLNMERRSNVEAFLAHLTGVQVERACKNCSKGHGPWSECIIYDGTMCGSCTNCWFNASGSRCTFHENNQNSIYAPAPLYNPHSAGMPSQQIQFPRLNPQPQLLPQIVAQGNPSVSLQGEAAAHLYPTPPGQLQSPHNFLHALGVRPGE
ncbi:hypothetical protein F53441_3334 [Fusarium austroafricanum]|uniref:Uncharacterized protein n=1 Tax=Fusarium austroafricanum TaxID=2364996 RepID=A0A8H4PAU5_9HYPO|nr:hypothetical protein F53441_3334 [Fusarium austroafricanum]